MSLKMDNKDIHRCEDALAKMNHNPEFFNTINFISELIKISGNKNADNIELIFREGEVSFYVAFTENDQLIEDLNIASHIKGCVQIASKYEEYLNLGQIQLANAFNQKNKGKPRKIYDKLTKNPVISFSIDDGNNVLLIDRKDKRHLINGNITDLELNEAVISAIEFQPRLHIIVEGYDGRSRRVVKLNISEEYLDTFIGYARQLIKLNITYNVLFPSRSPKEGELLTIEEWSEVSEQMVLFDPNQE